MNQKNPTLADQVKQMLENMPPIKQVNTYAVGPITIIELVETPAVDDPTPMLSAINAKRSFTATIPLNLQMVTDRGLVNQMHPITFEIPQTAKNVREASEWAFTNAQAKASEEIKRLRMSAIAQGLGT